MRKSEAMFVYATKTAGIKPEKGSVFLLMYLQNGIFMMYELHIKILTASTYRLTRCED